MSILHLMKGPNYAMLRPFMRFVSENFSDADHYFLFMENVRNIPDDMVNHPRFIALQGNGSVWSYLREYDRVILHSLSFSGVDQAMLLLFPGLMKKLVWVAWGADLYQWKRGGRNNLATRARNFVSWSFRRSVKYFVGVFPPDIEFFSETFKSSATKYYAPYVDGLYNGVYHAESRPMSIEQKVNSGKTINIQIGHSCSSILNHKKTLDNLARFAKENIKVYLPLSYGDIEYGDQVATYAKALFGEKTLCIREFLDKEEYMKLLSTMDICIFDSNRQIALGNIVPLLYMQKKIYLPSKSVMYRYFKSLGINICDCDELCTVSFAHLTKSVDMSDAFRYAKAQATDKNAQVEMWRKVFDLV